MIKKLFVTKTVNKAGVYCIMLYVNGFKTPVVVDDYVPVTAKGNIFACNSSNQELYAILLEKAWAKLHGCYASIEAGLPSFAATHLTGAPSDSFWNGDIAKEPETFWRKLQRCDDYHYVMIAATRGQGELESKEGILSGHAYSLIDVKEF
jgi:hypothetical protein